MPGECRRAAKSRAGSELVEVPVTIGLLTVSLWYQKRFFRTDAY